MLVNEGKCEGWWCVMCCIAEFDLGVRALNGERDFSDRRRAYAIS